MSGGSAVSGGAGTLRSVDYFPLMETRTAEVVDLPNSASFVSSLKQGRFPVAGLVLRSSHDYLEGR